MPQVSTSGKPLLLIMPAWYCIAFLLQGTISSLRGIHALSQGSSVCAARVVKWSASEASTHGCAIGMTRARLLYLATVSFSLSLVK